MSTIHSPSFGLVIDAVVAGRKAMGLTQVELAEIWKKPQSVIARLEAKERRLDVIEFLELCVILGLNPNEIITNAHNHLKAGLFVKGGY